MSFREQWIELQRNVHEILEDEAFPFGREEGEEFSRYLDSYEAALPARWTAASLESVLAQARKARAVIVGDYHTHPASANTVLWLIEELTRSGKRPIVFLEALPDGFRSETEAYWSGRLLEGLFLSMIGYRRSFGFDWSLYRPIVRTARRYGAPVFGINARSSSAGLAVRDSFAASVIADRLKTAMRAGTPGRLIKRSGAVALILIGEKHTAGPHLPAVLAEAFKSRGVTGSIVTIHRNVPSAYFSLLEKGYGVTPGAFRGGGGRFLIQDVSPLALSAKNLHWYNREEIVGQIPDSGGFGLDLGFRPAFDEVGLFRRILEAIASFLGLDVPELEDFHVFTGEDLFFFERFREDGMETGRYAALLAKASLPGCFYVPEYSLAYMKEIAPAALGRTSALHIATKKCGRKDRDRYLEEVRGSLGAALLDPFAGHSPPTPRHPALNGSALPHDTLSGASRERSGSELGFEIFRALAARSLALKRVLPLFEGEDRAKRVLDRL